VEQQLHLRAIRGQRTAAICGHALQHATERNVEPGNGAVGEHQCSVIGFDKRTASGGNDDVPGRQQLAEHLSLGLTEIRFARLREDGRDRTALERFDPQIDVLHPPPETPRRPRVPPSSCPPP
jgi:hypothetical protein